MRFVTLDRHFALKNKLLVYSGSYALLKTSLFIIILVCGYLLVSLLVDFHIVKLVSVVVHYGYDTIFAG